MANHLFVDSDNLVKVTALTDKETGALENGATIVMALFGDTPQHLNAAAVVTEGGKAKIAITGHGLTVDDYVWIVGTHKYDKGYNIDSVPDANNIVLDTAFVAETFTGLEELYKAVKRSAGTWPEPLTHVAEPADPDGYYDGLLPAGLAAIYPDTWYYIFAMITKVVGEVTYKTTLRKKWRAIFAPVG